jgi:release factor glutamine methyltransferase
MNGDRYLASDDSDLLRKSLEGRPGERCLEIGAGNGGNLARLAERFSLVVGTDLVRPSMVDWKEAGANFVLADGGSCLLEGVFDLVAFNPPYIPGPIEDRAVDGGPSLEVPKRFLRDALKAVKKGGDIVFVLNEEAKLEEFRQIALEGGFRLRPIGSRKLFFEELTAYLASEARPT